MKEKKLTKTILSKGVNMKKTLLVLALALVLVFAFTTLAGAKYAGYFRDGSALNVAGTPSKAPGYLSWGSVTARAIIVNGVVVNLNANSGAVGQMAQNSVSTTLRNNPHGGYTTGTTKCAVCHSVHRAYAGDGAGDGVLHGQYRLAQRNACEQCHTTYGTGGATKLIEWAATGAGPHGSSNCTGYCHLGGIHGLGTSRYWGMNAYLLGNGVNTRVLTLSDDMITDEVANGPNVPFTATNMNWFLSGTDTSIDSGAKPDAATMTQFAFGKATATGYTCARGGCHTNSVFAVNRWGVSLARDVRNPNGMATGHRSSPAPGLHVGSRCFPCHPGNSIVGYTTATDPVNDGAASTAANTLVDMGRSYGCDQCHDMVGVATGTTAWPHANRAIDVYEWNATGTRITSAMSSGNLWMYSGSIASLANANNDKTYANAAVKAWTVNRQAVGADTVVGKINDGVCLKCHLPVDKLSQDALSAGTARAGTYSGPTTVTVDGVTRIKFNLAVSIYHADYNVEPRTDGSWDYVVPTALPAWATDTSGHGRTASITLWR